ncbi:MAG: fibronectin type III domain-containing protein [Ignavibacteria bacterium]|nr:fibronectin type III domain-containing protein [Ignavibacteria bacterium]
MQKVLTEPQITLHAASGDKPGEIELLWQPMRNSPSYIVQVNLFAGSNRTWKHADIVSKTRYTATGLKSGKRYSFRVAPVTKNGQQEWSITVTEKAA